MQPNTLEIAKLIVELVRAMAWPMLALLVLILFYKPIRLAITGIAEKFGTANKLTFGSLSIEIANKARELGDPVLAAGIGALSPVAIEQLLRAPTSGSKSLLAWAHLESARGLYLPPPPEISALAELETRGLVVFTTPLKPFVEQIRNLPLVTAASTSDLVGYLSPYPPDSDEERALFRQTFTLTKSGLNAVEAIIRAVSSQFAGRID